MYWTNNKLTVSSSYYGYLKAEVCRTKNNLYDQLLVTNEVKTDLCNVDTQIY